jgi:hypothetical protein
MKKAIMKNPKMVHIKYGNNIEIKHKIHKRRNLIY